MATPAVTRRAACRSWADVPKRGLIIGGGNGGGNGGGGAGDSGGGARGGGFGEGDGGGGRAGKGEGGGGGGEGGADGGGAVGLGGVTSMERAEKVAEADATPERAAAGHSASSQRAMSGAPHRLATSTMPSALAAAEAEFESSGSPVADDAGGSRPGAHLPAQEPVAGFEAEDWLKKGRRLPSCSRSTLSTPTSLSAASTTKGCRESISPPGPKRARVRWPPAVSFQLPQFTAHPHWLQLPSPPRPSEV